VANKIPHLFGAQVDRLEMPEIAFVAGFGSETLEQRKPLIITDFSKELRLQCSPQVWHPPLQVKSDDAVDGELRR